jgi:hypothetical protein
MKIIRTYRVIDFLNLADYLVIDRDHLIQASSPKQAAQRYLDTNNIQGEAVRSMVDVDIKLLVEGTRGTYLYQVKKD